MDFTLFVITNLLIVLRFPNGSCGQTYTYPRSANFNHGVDLGKEDHFRFKPMFNRQIVDIPGNPNQQ